MREARLQTIAKIKQYEQEAKFDAEVEPTFEYQKLDAKRLDLLHRRFSSKFKAWWAYFLGESYFKGLVRKKQIVFKPPEGIANLAGLQGGAIVTCNHIHPADSYGVLLALMRHFRHGKGSGKRLLWKVVAESNYSFPGMFGFIMRNADTIPFAIDEQRPNHQLTARAMQAAAQLVARGKKLLIYPEASMWLHYRKPRPLKKGAFYMAAKFNVPVIPCFYTLEDTAQLDADGFPVQAYTLHVGKPIYPDPNLNVTENTAALLEQNAQFWQETYKNYYEN